VLCGSCLSTFEAAADDAAAWHRALQMMRWAQSRELQLVPLVMTKRNATTNPKDQKMVL